MPYSSLPTTKVALGGGVNISMDMASGEVSRAMMGKSEGGEEVRWQWMCSHAPMLVSRTCLFSGPGVCWLSKTSCKPKASAVLKMLPTLCAERRLSR